jgi:hypothetical protein
LDTQTRAVYPFELPPEQAGLPYAVPAAVIHRTTHHLKTVPVTEETESVLSSRPFAYMNAAPIQAFRRGHWGLEAVHCVRDVTFGEDASTIRTGHAPQNLAALHHVVIGLCALEAARHHQRTSSLPRFRCDAKNDPQRAVDFLCRPLGAQP